MSSGNRQPRPSELDRLIDAGLKALIDEDDAAILAEAQENCENPKAVVAGLRSVIGEAVDRAGGRRLIEARRALDSEAGTVSNVVTWPLDRKRALVAELRREVKGLTMAARQGSAETEADLDAILEDFIDLEIIDKAGKRI